MLLNLPAHLNLVVSGVKANLLLTHALALAMFAVELLPEELVVQREELVATHVLEEVISQELSVIVVEHV